MVGPGRGVSLLPVVVEGELELGLGLVVEELEPGLGLFYSSFLPPLSIYETFPYPPGMSFFLVVCGGRLKLFHLPL